MIDELKMVHKIEYFCTKKLHAWFKPEGIRSYGKCKRLGDGYTLWGTKKVKGVDVSNLYYVDETKIAKWRGKDIGWRTLQTNEKDSKRDFNNREDIIPNKNRGVKRRTWKKIRMVHKGNERIFNNIDELCNQMNFNKNSVNCTLDTDIKYKGILLYRIYEEEN